MVGFLQYKEKTIHGRYLIIITVTISSSDKSWIAYLMMSMYVMYHQHFTLYDLHSVTVNFLFSSLPALTVVSVFSISPLSYSGPRSVCYLGVRVPLKATTVIPNPLSAAAHLNHSVILPLYLHVTFWLSSFSCLSCCSFLMQRSYTPTVLSIMEDVDISVGMTLPISAALAAVHLGISWWMTIPRASL